MQMLRRQLGLVNADLVPKHGLILDLVPHTSWQEARSDCEATCCNTYTEPRSCTLLSVLRIVLAFAVLTSLLLSTGFAKCTARTTLSAH